MRRATLVTGATGFIGLQLVDALLDRGHEVIALVRAIDAEGAQARMGDLLATLHEVVPQQHLQLLTALAGDVREPRAGLSQPEWDRLLTRTARVVHCAADVRFDIPLEDARRINVEGTRVIAGLAAELHEREALEKFVHVSTAFVCGSHQGRFGESDLDLGQEFHNTYERTKFEAESAISEAHPDLPVVVVRPSIVVGEAASGWTNAFNVLYWPLRAFSKGWIPYVPADGDAQLDVVTVDYVVSAIRDLLFDEWSDGIYNLTAAHCLPLSALVSEAARCSGLTPAQIVPPDQIAELSESLDSAQREALVGLAELAPYLMKGPRFRSERAQAALPELTQPPIEQLLERLIEFAISSRWGRRDRTREQARRAALAARAPT